MLVRELLRSNEVLPPQLDRIGTELAGSKVDDAFEHEVVHFGSESAVGALLALVREDASYAVLDGFDAVRANDLRHGVAVRAHAELDIGAVVVDDVEPKAREPAVRVDGELDVVAALRAVVVAAREVVEPVFHVLNGPSYDLLSIPARR